MYVEYFTVVAISLILFWVIHTLTERGYFDWLINANIGKKKQPYNLGLIWDASEMPVKEKIKSTINKKLKRSFDL